MTLDPARAFSTLVDAPVPGASDGPLAGLTFGVKDIIDVAGYRTGCGNPVKLAAAAPATAHASVVQRLLDAGARFAGKLHTVELAYSLDGRNRHYGTPRNPAAPGRVPGGAGEIGLGQIPEQRSQRRSVRQGMVDVEMQDVQVVAEPFELHPDRGVGSARGRRRAAAAAG